MNTFNRPITPPSDRTKDSAIANGDAGTIPSFNDNNRNEDLNDFSQFKRQQEAPSAPPTSNDNGDTFTSKEENKLSDATAATRKYDNNKTNNYQRNDTTRRIESEVLSILQWKNPVRSGIIFSFIVSSIILTRWYSLLQISAACLTLAIGINLIYVNLILQSQKVLTNQDPSHPYNNVIHNEEHTMIDKQSVNHYSTVITELSETVIRALTRIIFIENTMTSVKWMGIFFVIWKVSAHISTMDIVLLVVVSAFTVPRLYISNKDIVDAQIQKGQILIQNGFEKAQSAASQGAQDTYTKARAFVAHVGTTATDAKNTLSKASATEMKENKSL